MFTFSNTYNLIAWTYIVHSHTYISFIFRFQNGPDTLDHLQKYCVMQRTNSPAVEAWMRTSNRELACCFPFHSELRLLKQYDVFLPFNIKLIWLWYIFLYCGGFLTKSPAIFTRELLFELIQNWKEMSVIVGLPASNF